MRGMSRLEAMPEKSFLQHLLDKRADVERLGEKTGADVGGLWQRLIGRSNNVYKEVML